jgi:hypothetical protein
MIDKALLKETLGAAFENFKTAIEHHTNINIKRADGGWTVGEISDHIVKASGSDFGNTEQTTRPYDRHAKAIRDLFLNFKLKFPSAPELQPTPAKYSKADLFASIDENKRKLLAMIDNDDLTVTCTDIALPVWGTLTKYEWLVLIESHTIRHTNQVNEFSA